MNPVRIAIGGACVLALVACNRRDEKTNESTTTSGERPREYDRGTTTMTGAPMGAVTYETASARIVAARCDRAAACNDIGDKKAFVDRTVCMHELHSKLADDMKPSDCPGGMDAKNLDDCLTSIQKDSCGNSVDSIARMGSCKASDLCIKAGQTPSR
jgi:hypothetical protein